MFPSCYSIKPLASQFFVYTKQSPKFGKWAPKLSSRHTFTISTLTTKHCWLLKAPCNWLDAPKNYRISARLVYSRGQSHYHNPLGSGCTAVCYFPFLCVCPQFLPHCFLFHSAFVPPKTILTTNTNPFAWNRVWNSSLQHSSNAQLTRLRYATKKDCSS